MTWNIDGTAQDYSADLTAIAALTSAADKSPYATGSGTWAMATLTSFGRSLIDDADAAAGRTTLGLVIGTNVQAFDAELAAVAGLVSAADRVPYFTGSGTASLATFTAAGRALVDDADAAAQRTTLGLAIGTDVQAYSATLLALATYGLDQHVIATIAVANATAGATGAALTLTLKRADNSAAIATARQVYIGVVGTQYATGFDPNGAHVTFGTATVGSIIASGAGWALVQTDAAGAFACTATNASDETLYFSVGTAPSVSDQTKACLVIGSNSDAATWSA